MVSPLSPALPSLLPPATKKKKCVHLFWLMVVPFSPTPAIKCSRGKQRKEVCTCFDSWSLFSYHPHLHCYQMPQRQKKKERLRVVPFSPTPASLLPNAAEAREKGKAQGHPTLTNPSFVAASWGVKRREREDILISTFKGIFLLSIPFGPLSGARNPSQTLTQFPPSQPRWSRLMNSGTQPFVSRQEQLVKRMSGSMALVSTLRFP